MDMMKLLLICGLIGIVFTGGCLNQPDFPPELQAVDDIVISFMESVEDEIPPPALVAPYFSSRQEVPLNNIPNADMENWSVSWVGNNGAGSHTYAGDSFYADGSCLEIHADHGDCVSGGGVYSIISPSFTLDHAYVSFYARNWITGGYCQGNSNYFYGTGTGTFVLYDSSNNIILQKNICYMSGISQYSGYNGIHGTAFESLYSKGSSTGGDGDMWYKITIPMPASFVGSDVKLGFKVTTNSGAPPSHPVLLIDNFYYSTSTGDEIYLLEAPTAQFTYVVNKYNVTVDANISQTAGVLYDIKWNWGDGTITEGVESAHTYTFPGNKQITLTIMDNENLVDTATLVVSVDGTSYYAGPEGSNTAKIAPVAGFSYGLGGMTISVDGTYSTDDGTIALYTWDFDGVKKNGATATHTYTNGGTKTVTLTVTDNVGLEGSRKIEFYLPPTGVTQSTTIVDNPGTPPNAKFTYSLSASTITVDGSQSSDDENIDTYTWDWGDGSSSVGKTSVHTYSDMGTTRKIILTVKDNDGFTDTAEASITVQSYNAPPVVDTTDDDDDDNIPYTPPTTGASTSGSSSSSGGGNTDKSFPWWGLIVTITGALAVVVVMAVLMGGGKKKKGGLFKKKGGKKR